MKEIMGRKRVMLFMKGDPGHPKCGFSKQTVGIFRELRVEFGTYDILEDEGVRSGLSHSSLSIRPLITDEFISTGMKVLNNWPTFPQIIVDGELIGGLDILKDMVEDGSFLEMLAEEPAVIKAEE